MKRYLNFVFISSDWLHYHRREFTKSLSDNIISWGDIAVVELWEVSKIFGKIDCYLINRQIRSFSRKYYPDNKLSFWFFEPEHYLLAESNKNSKIVYDYYDDHEFNYDGSIKPDKVRKNKVLVMKADLTICLSKFTEERLSKYGDNVIYLKNSSSLRSFNQNKESNVDEHYSFRSNKKLIGYLGTVRNWIDFSFIEEVLKKLKEVNVVLKNINMKLLFKKYENFFTIGFVHPDRIYDHIKKFDAGIIPFKVNNFTRSVFPNKFFEYAVCNIPVVSTNLPELEEYRNDIGYAKTQSEFAEYCRMALNGEFDDKIIRNRKNAEENTWNINVSSLNKILMAKFGIV